MDSTIYHSLPDNSLFCPCCNASVERWLDFSSTYRNVVCPLCQCQPRHRSLKLYLRDHTNLYREPLRVLHFAPELRFREELAALPNIEYVTADLLDPSVDFNIDITQIPFPDESFDVIFCSHVLEHVPDDRKAMQELLRILKPGGWAFLQVPIDSQRSQTFEDLTITAPEERLKHFWQEDHVRLYGLDYRDRLAQVGFNVQVESFVRSLPPQDIRKYGLDPTEDLYFGFKPQLQKLAPSLPTAASQSEPSSVRVSVVMPAHNYGRYIAEALDSVLQQSYSDYELIVIDDGSTDHTREAVKPYLPYVQYVYQANQGVSEARNHGIRLAKGEYIIFLDADDMFLPDMLAAQVACLDANPDVDFAVSGWYLVDETGKTMAEVKLWENLPDLSLKDWLMWRPVLPSATMFRRHCLEAVGGYDTQTFPAEDVDCILRIVLAGFRAIWVPRCLVHYRQHGTAITQKTLRQAKGFDALHDRLFSKADLLDEVQRLEKPVRYACLVWVAWRLYHTGHLPEMADYLRKSLDHTPYNPIQTISNWTELLGNFSLAYGYQLKTYDLTQSLEWQRLVHQVVTIPPPRVSVIIPTYNTADYIAQAVESVLSQTYTSYEVIVVDDGSTDNTREVLSPYLDRIRYVYHENRGVSASRNRGINLARGELIALLDSDDFFFPDKLAEQVAVFDANPNVGLVNSGFRIVNSQGEAIADMEWWNYMPRLDVETWILYKPVLPSAMMFRREWLERVGGFDRRFPPAEDLDLTFRLILAGCEAAWLPKLTVNYRAHDSSASLRGTPKLARSAAAVLENFFQRADLPASIRQLERSSRYQTLVWLAWRLYQAGFSDEMADYLQNSLEYTPFSTAETIANWIDCFAAYSRSFGYQFDVYTLTGSEGWQQAIRDVLERTEEAAWSQTLTATLI